MINLSIPIGCGQIDIPSQDRLFFSTDMNFIPQLQMNTNPCRDKTTEKKCTENIQGHTRHLPKVVEYGVLPVSIMPCSEPHNRDVDVQEEAPGMHEESTLPLIVETEPDSFDRTGDEPDPEIDAV